MLPTTAPPSGRTSSSIRPAVVLAVAVAAALFATSAAAVAVLPHYDGPSPPYRGPGWLEGWAQWDSGWYQFIADHGYTYSPGRQGPAAFFPAYPLLMRAVGAVVGNVFVAGVLVTLASGIGATVLFWRWLQERLDSAAARTALLLFVLFPYAFFLFGAVYADALFVVAVLGAFTLVERDRPWLAGLAGAVATAARPIGAVLVVALVVRVLERGERPSWRSAGVLVSGLGIGAFSTYLWVRFGDPLAFSTIQEAWDQEASAET
jgi:Gpi18-like mannosyltransferase